MHLRIRVDGDGPSRTVRLSGECDVASAPALQEALWALRGPEVTQVVVDASDLDFLDSYGIGVIVGALKHMREADGELRIKDPSPPVRRTLELAGLDRVMPID